jgi:hypothetical protein
MPTAGRVDKGVSVFSADERAEIRALVYTEFISINKMMQRAGSYRFICLLNGKPVFSHEPVGKVIWKRPL